MAKTILRDSVILQKRVSSKASALLLCTFRLEFFGGTFRAKSVWALTARSRADRVRIAPFRAKMTILGHHEIRLSTCQIVKERPG